MRDTTRADLHVHSSASGQSKLGVQQALSIPECATEPIEVYGLAKRRGMDLVTITDHDTIEGVLAIADLPGVFISEELTASFKGEPQAVHVLCYGITPDDHEWLQAHAEDVEACAGYLQGHEITAALAHPFYAVAAPLTARHRRVLAELFPIWETRNGSRARELNLPAFVYIETHGGTGIGGSDDHAGIDVGRTFTQTPGAAGPEDFLAHIRAGQATAHGDQGSAAKWTHAALALALRALEGEPEDPGVSASGGRGHEPSRRREPGSGRKAPARPDPAAVLRIVERVMREGDARRGQPHGDLGPIEARALLRAWIHEVSSDEPRGSGLIERLRDGEIKHTDAAREARRIHERKLATAASEAVAQLERHGASAVPPAAWAMFDACISAIPYAAAGAFLGREKRKMVRSEGERPRVAIVADGLGSIHGVARVIEQIRDRGVRGFEVEVIGTDPSVDRRLSAVAEIEVPFYPGMRIGVPSLPAVVEAIAEGRYDLVHVCSPGPASAVALMLARILELPVLGSYHTELAAYAGLRSGRIELEAFVEVELGAFYRACDLVLSPSPASDERLASLGLPAGRTARWDRGVDIRLFSPDRRTADLLRGELNVLYVGRRATEKGIDMLASAFLAARRRDPRLHLSLAGSGPEEERLRRRLRGNASFLGWLTGEKLAQAYASADLFVFASQTDTFGQVILEAQASGLPVVAVGTGGPAALIQPGVSGILVDADVPSLSGAMLSLAAAPDLRRALSQGGLSAVSERSWEGSLARLAAGYRAALARSATSRRRRAA